MYKPIRILDAVTTAQSREAENGLTIRYQVIRRGRASFAQEVIEAVDLGSRFHFVPPPGELFTRILRAETCQAILAVVAHRYFHFSGSYRTLMVLWKLVINASSSSACRREGLESTFVLTSEHSR